MTLPRIAVLGHRQFSPLIRKLEPEFREKAELIIYEDVFEHALSVSERIMAQRQANVILTAGANAAYLRENSSFPIATIKVTPYDLMRALMRAREHDERIGLIVYQRILPELEEVKKLFPFDIAQRAYSTVEEAVAAVRELASQGYRVIVGSSITVEAAQREGLLGVLVYSDDSARQGLAEAIELARVALHGEARRERLSSLIHNLREGLLALDFTGRVQAANPALERLTGLAESDLLRDGVRSLPGPLRSLMADGLEEDAEGVVDLNGRTVVVSRSPLYESGQHTGSVFTLLESTTIQQSERKLRSHRPALNYRARQTFAAVARHTPALKETIHLGMQYAGTDATVMLTGESGTGKEWFAQAIHNHSARRGGPFIPINCAALPEALLESELFGYEEGAFTGARRGGKSGLIELAHTGTLFLDEIGDMPIALQTRLLRVLQEREVQRLGAQEPTRIDIRVVAATLQPLEELLRAGRFREDLYYRINVLRIEIPPLRARSKDIPALAGHFLTRVSEHYGAEIRHQGLLDHLLPYLTAYHWPGNVRELENVIERFVICANAQKTNLTIDEQWIHKIAPEFERGHDGPDFIDYAAEVKKHGSVAVAARMLGISRTTLWRRLSEERHQG